MCYGGHTVVMLKNQLYNSIVCRENTNHEAVSLAKLNYHTLSQLFQWDSGITVADNC